MKFRALNLVFFLAIALNANAADDCASCLARPLELKGFVSADFARNIYDGKTSLESLTFKYKGSSEQNSYWRVYSDRVKNPIYSSPNGLKKSRTLDFMEQVYVIDKDPQNWLKVAAFEAVEGQMTYVELGWIPVRNMLINDHALSNSNSITKKGLVLVNMDNVAELQAMTKAAEKGIEIDKYMFYGDPERRSPLGEERKLEIRYVLKELSGVKLLSVNDKIDNLSQVNRQNNVNGWMQDLNVTDWDTRVCLETSYGPEYSEVYSGKKVPVFIKKSQMDAFVSLGTDDPTEAIYKLDVTTQRKVNYMMRMPILQNYEGSDLKQVATLGSVKGAGEEIPQKVAEMKQLVQKLKSKRNNINVLFVLDATKSMSDFFPAIKNGMENIIALNKEKHKKAVKFGIAVYRDYEDGEKAFDIVPLTPNGQDIFNFLATLSSFSSGKTRWESQYNGILRGLAESKMRADESNIIVLIGDAGNARQDAKGLTLDKVSAAIAALNANLVAFQVTFGSQPAYTDFNSDAIDMIRELGLRSEKKQDLIPVLKPVDGRSNSFELQFKNPNNPDQVEVYAEGGFGRFIYANDNEAMPLKVLNDNLTEALDEYLAAIDKQIINYSNYIKSGDLKMEGGDKFEDANKENLRDYLESEGMTSAEIDLAMQQFSQFSVKGFTKTRFYNAPLDCFTPVVFLSDEEVDGMIEVFDDIDPQASSAEAKLQIYRGLIAQTKAALGESSDERVEQKTLSEIWTILLGVPFDEQGEYGTLKNIPLKDIPNSNHPQLPKFIIQFQNSVALFNKSNLEEDRFELNDQNYYWVPLRKIPGNG
jgi:hypothetical protein